MQEFFKPPPVLADEASFAQYRLGANPFPGPEILKQEGKSERKIFNQQVQHKEIQKLVSVVEKETKEAKPQNILVYKDKQVANSQNLAVLVGMLPVISHKPAPRIFTLPTLLPLIVRDMLPNLLDKLIDLLQPEDLRNCVYAVIYKHLEELEKSNKASEVLPDVDVSELMKEMNQTEGKALDDILFPQPPPEEVSEEETRPEPEDELKKIAESLEAEGKAESETDEEKKESPEDSEEAEEEEPPDPRRDNLVKFIEEAVEQEPFDENLKQGIKTALNEGFENAKKQLEPKEDLRKYFISILRLFSHFYNKTVITMDQFEIWPKVEATEKSEFLGVMTELPHLTEGNVFILFMCPPKIAEEIGLDNLKVTKTESLDLGLIRTKDLKTLGTEEELPKILANFLQADFYRQQELAAQKETKHDELYPFTKSGTKELADLYQGDINQILTGAGKLLEEGKASGYPSIDAQFVKEKLAPS